MPAVASCCDQDLPNVPPVIHLYDREQQSADCGMTWEKKVLFVLKSAGCLYICPRAHQDMTLLLPQTSALPSAGGRKKPRPVPNLASLQQEDAKLPFLLGRAPFSLAICASTPAPFCSHRAAVF